jgi:hypothetical protein
MSCIAKLKAEKNRGAEELGPRQQWALAVGQTPPNWNTSQNQPWLL